MTKIYVFDHEILRTPCEKITDQKEIIDISNELSRIASKMRAYGISAPQIGISKRIFVINPEAFNIEVTENQKFSHVYINPEIMSRSVATLPSNEGCLSIPGVRSQVRRNASIDIIAEDPVTAQKYMQTITGDLARVIQHEYDHLEGVLFIDHLTRQLQRKALNEWEKIAPKFEPELTYNV